MTHPRYNGRAARVREFLHKLRPHGATVVMLVEALEPDCPRVKMSATAGTLVKAGKLRAAKVRGVVRYYATDQVTVDGRAAANAVGKRRKKPRAGRTGADATAQRGHSGRVHAAPQPQQATAAKRTPVPAARPPLQRFCVTYPAPSLQPARQSAAESVDAFLARGGRIDVLPQGAVSRPLKFDHRAANEASWQARQRRIADGEI